MTRIQLGLLLVAGALSAAGCRDKEMQARVDELESRLSAMEMDTKRAIEDARHDLRMFRGDVANEGDAAKGKQVEIAATLRELTAKVQALDLAVQAAKAGADDLGKSSESLTQRVAASEMGLAKVKMDLADITTAVGELKATASPAAEATTPAPETKPPETPEVTPPPPPPNNKGRPCPKCGGMGKILNRRMIYDPCSECGGDGRTDD